LVTVRLSRRETHSREAPRFVDLGLGKFVDEPHGDDAPLAFVEFGDHGALMRCGYPR
jgi:hypothetical protein